MVVFVHRYYLWILKYNTVFRRINMPGAKAESEPLSLSNCNESRTVYTWILELYVLKVWFRLVKLSQRYSQTRSKFGGRIYSSRCIYSAKYGNCLWWLWSFSLLSPHYLCATDPRDTKQLTFTLSEVGMVLIRILYLLGCMWWSLIHHITFEPSSCTVTLKLTETMSDL